MITHPRRFGKTLNMSMLECFFSVDYADRGELFEGLNIWQEEEYRQLQGTYPVIALSFARVKESNVLNIWDKEYFDKICANKASEIELTSSLNYLSDFLYRYYGRNVINILRELLLQALQVCGSIFHRELIMLK